MLASCSSASRPAAAPPGAAQNETCSVEAASWWCIDRHGQRAEAPRRVRHLTARQQCCRFLPLFIASARRLARWLALPSGGSSCIRPAGQSGWWPWWRACGGGGGDAPALAYTWQLCTPRSSPVPAGTDATRCAARLRGQPDRTRQPAACRRCELRQQRQLCPAAALTWNAKLAQAATAHLLDIMTNNFFDHVIERQHAGLALPPPATYERPGREHRRWLR